MNTDRAVEFSAVRTVRLLPVARGLIVAGLSSFLAIASAEEPRDRSFNIKRGIRVEYLEKQPAPAAPVVIRKEGLLLTGRASMLVDGIHVGIEMSRLDEPPSDVEHDPEAPQEPWLQIRIEEGAFDHAFFIGNDMKPIDKLQQLLDQELQVVESVCPLELAQRRKLRLAGQGDIQRLLQQIEDLRPQFEGTWYAPASKSRQALQEVWALTSQATMLRKKLLSGAFGPESLFDKNLRRTVTKLEYAQIFDKRHESNTVKSFRILR